MASAFSPVSRVLKTRILVQDKINNGRPITSSALQLTFQAVVS